MKYKYEVDGTASGGQSWKTTGHILVSQKGNFADVASGALKASFLQMTKGEAVFGLPGVGCNGPYSVKRMVIEVVDETDDFK